MTEERYAELEARLADKNKELGELQGELDRNKRWLDAAKADIRAVHDFLDKHRGPDPLSLTLPTPKEPRLLVRMAAFVKMYGHGLGDQCALVTQLVKDLHNADQRTLRLCEAINCAVQRQTPVFEKWDELMDDHIRALEGMTRR